MDEPVTLQDLKTMLQIKSTESDPLLALIIKQTTKSLRFKLSLMSDEKFPEQLDYIGLEVCIRRFNRLANEGMSSYSQEGESITFNTNDFDEFLDDINQWREDNGKNVKSFGNVAFINGYGGMTNAPDQ
ncbi:phage head-tail connector protein [Latilactobacillus curvatus]|uniref:phage head-tail connector protein n=1 Tax=Latilactobacillus curvatus TaxID=28038 RepID=UPI0020C7947C|nr:phage head-tail connector protein [Latilactobacillus curvatus]MCP8876515.1 phage head-tail connector protein [Latilactobacillus curvatus]